jgi:hypothetical protein
MKTHRQGRTGAGKRALRRAHAHRLLMTLVGICRELRAAQTDATLRTAYLEVELYLVKLAAKWRKEGGRARPVSVGCPGRRAALPSAGAGFAG